jgi:hypothetical protein
VAVELVAGLVWGLGIVFTAFAEDVGATKADKPNTTQYYVYDYQGKRVRTVTKSNHQVQSQRDYLPGITLTCPVGSIYLRGLLST